MTSNRSSRPTKPLSNIAFSLKTPDALVQLWQDALDGMHEDGTFERIHQYWLRKIAEASFINTSGG